MEDPSTGPLKDILYDYINKKITGLRADPSPEPSEETRIAIVEWRGLKRERMHIAH